MDDDQDDFLVPEVVDGAKDAERFELLPGVSTSAHTPALVAEAGKLAEKAFWEYFIARISNKNTRMDVFRPSSACRSKITSRKESAIGLGFMKKAENTTRCRHIILPKNISMLIWERRALAKSPSPLFGVRPGGGPES